MLRGPTLRNRPSDAAHRPAQASLSLAMVPALSEPRRPPAAVRSGAPPAVPDVLSHHAPAARLVATVGHELRTPLATALLYLRVASDRIQRAPHQDRARAALAVATAELQRLDRLVARVTEIERLGRPVVRARSIDLGQVVREAVWRAQASRFAGLASVETIVPARIEGWWDDLAVEQIVQNLLSNALKFGAGRPVRVSVTAQPPGGAVIVVQDRGVGIRAADRERIFQRYARAVPERAGGLGLGLWLVKQLAEAHRGHVAVTSRPGRGSTFTVTLQQFRATNALAPSPPR